MIVIFGTILKKDTSNTPWWVSPSSATSPALSIISLTLAFIIPTSCITWSYALWRNVEYKQTKGIIPLSASPTANVTACCSAIPTSKNLSGNILAYSVNPVPDSIAAVIAAIFLFSFAALTIHSPASAEKVFDFCFVFNSPVSISKGAIPWNLEGFCSAILYPFPLTVLTWTSLGPLIDFTLLKVFIRSS